MTEAGVLPPAAISRRTRCRGAAFTGGLLAAIALGAAPGGWAHAFLTRSEPRAGATVKVPPAHVRLWFDGPIEPLFAAILVERDRQRVDNGDGRVSPRDNTLLEVGLPPLPPGRYRVAWSVVARDGHRKDGDFAFRVK